MEFEERHWEGSPRWDDPAIKNHVSRIKRLSRTPAVAQAMKAAYKQPNSFRRKPMRLECINPACSNRISELIGTYNQMNNPSKRDQYNKVLGALKGLGDIAGNKTDQLKKDTGQCNCGEPIYPILASPITGKFVYILKEKEGKLVPVMEVLLASREKIKQKRYLHLRPGDENTTPEQRDRNRKTFETCEPLSLPNPVGVTWHFFLTPARLYPRAFKMLTNAPELARKKQKAYNKLNERHRKAAPINWNLQPWSITYKATFTKEQVERKVPAYILLVDPFAYAFACNDKDFLGIYTAQQELLRNPEEQAKSFIAGVLKVVSQKKWDKKEKEMVDDPANVKGALAKIPSRYRREETIAHAWIKHYQNAKNFLNEAMFDAGCRLVSALEHAGGHRIVERTLQESSDPSYLAFGLVHWNAVMNDMWASPRTASYLNNMPRTRIPLWNVKNGKGLGRTSKVHKVVGNQVALQIAVLLAPTVVKGSPNPQDAIRDILVKLGIKTAPGIKEIQLATETAVSIKEKQVTNFLKMSDTSGTDLSHTLAVARNRRTAEYISLFNNGKKIVDSLNLIAGFADYAKKGRYGESQKESFKRAKGRVEHPIKVADFMLKRTQDLLKYRARNEKKLIDIMQKFDDAPATLTAAQRSLVAETRALNLYARAGTWSRRIGGPVALITGGIDFLIEADNAIEAWDNGDPGAALGYGVLGGAAACSMVVAGATTASMMSGAAAASWVPLVGWIAAALMIGGTVLVYCLSDGPIEAYAKHCWLGNEYGKGDWDSRLAYIGNLCWPRLRWTPKMEKLKERWLEDYGVEEETRFQIQQLALMRMLSNFQIAHYSGASRHRSGGWIVIGYMPPCAFFDIKITTFELDSSKKPTGKQETITGQLFGDGSVVITSNAKPERAEPYNFSQTPGGGFKAELEWIPTSLDKKRLEWNMDVRLDLNGGGKTFLPASKKYVGFKGASKGILDLGIRKKSSAAVG